MRNAIKEIYAEVLELWKKKGFAAGIILTMLLSFATLLFNPTVGIDDTSFGIYYEDGVSPAMGRWCLFLINKIFPLAYNPYFVEAAGLLIFCISVSLWCVVFGRLLGKRVPVWGYMLFGCAMISNPIISEVVIWYLQDGIYLGYGMAALAVLTGMNAYRSDRVKGWKQRAGCLALSAGFLTAALGFYESFMIVFLIAMLMVFLLVRVLKSGKKQAGLLKGGKTQESGVQAAGGYCGRPGKWFVNILITCVSAVVLRTVIVELMILVFRLQDQTRVLRSRGLHEFLAWFGSADGLAGFVKVLQTFFVKYYINAAVYLPITVLVLAEAVLGGFALYQAIRKKDGWIMAAAAGIVLVPWILPVLEGVATYYRTSQYIPLVSAFMVLLASWWLACPGASRLVRGSGLILVFVLLYNQAYEMNKWLYTDAQKYEDTKRTLDTVALSILENCDASKPVCIIGEYETPSGLIADAYCPVWSRKYKVVSSLVNLVNPQILEEFTGPQGYAFAETPQLSFIKWGATAFYGFDREIIKFWKMHGFSFSEDGNLQHYAEAGELMKDGPVWPAEGSIVELEDYIIVNFG